MKRVSSVLLAVTLGVYVVALATAYAEAPSASDERYVQQLPAGYRNFKLISVARKQGELDDIRAILGNDIALKAYRSRERPLPDGAIVARLAWRLVPNELNDRAFGAHQSFVAGAPKNGVQIMIKDSQKYATSGGWGFGQFNDGKAVDVALLQTCLPCHQRAGKARDLVFTDYAP